MVAENDFYLKMTLYFRVTHILLGEWRPGVALKLFVSAPITCTTNDLMYKGKE